ncbi:MAG: aminotransferase class V-fold PLP-dependent enzyme, partial [Clostridia bacterium]|nr:aminotransferase class V-fold PLP-dependent enzyme [Clostridia bacterium]
MIYLDNAATTFPKPASVTEEIVKCITSYCGNPGRGSHRMAFAASEVVFSTREKLNGIFDGDGPENCVFTLNTTYALNIALKSMVTPSSHILISDLEHNSVFRQAVKLKRDGICDFDIFHTFGGDGDKILTDIKNKLKKNTRILICLVSSNICGIVLPVTRIGELCRKRNIQFIADAAQSAGIHEISIKKMNVDALCVPSHKGLYGAQGAGAVLFSSRSVKHLKSVFDGGSGSDSLNEAMPDALPDKLEAGTVSTPAIA